AFYERTMFATIGTVVGIKIAIFVVTGMYVKWWRYLTVKDMEGVLRSVVLASAAALIYLYMAPPLDYVRIPRSVAVLDFGFTLFLVGGVRLLARSLSERPSLRSGKLVQAAGTSVLIVGAGEAGRLLIREMTRQQLGLVPIGFV